MSCPICCESSLAAIGRIGNSSLLRCGACEFQLLSTPELALHGASYYDQYYRDCWGVAEDLRTVLDMKKATFHSLFSRIVKWTPKGRLLDVGCALGTLMETAQELGFDVYGIEISASGYQACSKRFGDNRVSSAQLSRGCYPSGYFDIITMTDVLEHVPNLDEAKSAVLDLLRPDGLWVITTPNVSSFSCRLMGLSWPHYKEEHLYYFNGRNLTKWLESDFEILQMAPARKTLSPRYIGHVLSSMRESPWLNSLGRILLRLPRAIGRIECPVAFGEMCIVARKAR